MASLCYRGAHGGMLAITEDGILFNTNKLLLSQEMRRFRVAYGDIKDVCSCSSLKIFPAVEIKLASGSKYKFIIFGRSRFLNLVNEAIAEAKRKARKAANRL